MTPGVFRPPPRLPSRSAFALCVSGLIFIMAGVTLPTPVYVFYETTWGMSATEITLIYAVYIGPLVIALLTVGGISDIIGRRPVLVTCFAIAALGMVIFAFAQDASWLVAARMTHGLATGGVLGALASGAVDWAPAKHPTWGSVAASAGPVFGLAVGGLASGVIVDTIIDPTQTIYFVFAAIFLALAIWTIVIREPPPAGGNLLRSFIPRMGVPRGARIAFLWLVPATLVIASAGGQFNALAPTIMSTMLDTHSSALAGAVLAVLHVSSALGALTGGRLSPRTLVLTGMTSLAVGVTGSLLCLLAAWPPGYVVGAALSGYGVGTTFLGCVKGATALAPAGHRAAILSTVNLTNFIGLTIPLIVAGIAVGLVGVPATIVWYTVAQLSLIAVAVLGQLLQRPSRPPKRAVHEHFQPGRSRVAEPR